MCAVLHCVKFYIVYLYSVQRFHGAKWYTAYFYFVQMLHCENLILCSFYNEQSFKLCFGKFRCFFPIVTACIKQYGNVITNILSLSVSHSHTHREAGRPMFIYNLIFIIILPFKIIYTIFYTYIH